MQQLQGNWWTEHSYIASIWTFIVSVGGTGVILWRSLINPINKRVDELSDKIKEEKENREAADLERDTKTQELRDAMNAEFGRVGAIEELFKSNAEDRRQLHNHMVAVQTQMTDIGRLVQDMRFNFSNRLSAIEAVLQIKSGNQP